MIGQETYDVLVAGGGSSGVAAAISAARNGAKTLLVDAGPSLGGELNSGINLLGCLSSRGEWIVGGVVRELLEECSCLGGYIGPISDFRPLHFVAFDPEIMRLAVMKLVSEAGVHLRLYSLVEETVVDNEADTDGTKVNGVVLINKAGRTVIKAKIFIDCSGDGDLAVGAGAAFEMGEQSAKTLQSVSLVFRMAGVESEKLLAFVEEQPANFAIGEFSDLSPSPEEGARLLSEQGLAKVSLVSRGPLLGGAIQRGEMFPASLVAVAPISLQRKEVSINATKVPNIDGADARQMSEAYPDLIAQVETCAKFLKEQVPGFEDAFFSGIAPRIGVRETRRIQGEYRLTGADVQNGSKREDGVAKGGHPIDIWQAGTDHQWGVVKDGGSYDIPYTTLIPKGIRNVLVAGRCLSSDREGQSSARVMGTCMALGQAAGTAASICLTSNDWPGDVRSLSVDRLRNVLISQGSVLKTDF